MRPLSLLFNSHTSRACLALGSITLLSACASRSVPAIDNAVIESPFASGTHAPVPVVDVPTPVEIPAPARAASDLPNHAMLERHENRRTVHSLVGGDLCAELRRHGRISLDLGAENVAISFLVSYSDIFLLEDPRHELRLRSTRVDELGSTTLQFEQMYGGIPVEGGQILVRVDQQLHVHSVHGDYVPTPSSVRTSESLSETEVHAIAALSVGAPESFYEDCRSELSIVQVGDDQALAPRLARRVRVPLSTRTWIVTVDAHSGDILGRSSEAESVAMLVP